MSIRSAATPVAHAAMGPPGPTRFEQVLACGVAYPRTVLEPWARRYGDAAKRRNEAKEKRAKRLETDPNRVKREDLLKEEDKILAEEAEEEANNLAEQKAQLKDARDDLKELQEDYDRVEAEALTYDDGSPESQRLVDELNEIDADIRKKQADIAKLEAEIASSNRAPNTVREFRDGAPSLQLTNNSGR